MPATDFVATGSNVKTGEYTQTLEGHTDDVSALHAVLGMDLVVTAGSYDKTAKVWNVKTVAVSVTSVLVHTFKCVRVISTRNMPVHNNNIT